MTTRPPSRPPCPAPRSPWPAACISRCCRRARWPTWCASVSTPSPCRAHSGLWAGLQIEADVADAAAVVDIGAAWPEIPLPDTTRVARHPLLVGPGALDAEEDLFAVRLPRALEYSQPASLNGITVDSPRARLGITASGHSYSTVLRALEDMGLDDRACAEIGLRLIRICLPWPLGSAELRQLTRGLDEVLVIEDKAPFSSPSSRRRSTAAPRCPGSWARSIPRVAPSSRRPVRSTRTPSPGRWRRAWVPTASRPRPRAPSGGPHPATAPGAARRCAAGPHTGLLLGVPAQHLHPGGRRPVGRPGHRLPHHGRLRRSRPGASGGDDPDGW